MGNMPKKQLPGHRAENNLRPPKDLQRNGKIQHQQKDLTSPFNRNVY